MCARPQPDARAWRGEGQQTSTMPSAPGRWLWQAGRQGYSSAPTFPDLVEELRMQ